MSCITRFEGNFDDFDTAGFKEMEEEEEENENRKQ
jgi:hypothetical protein